MSRLLPLSTAIMLSCVSTPAKPAPAALESLSLLEQAGRLPADFEQHFFNAPLVVRVEKEGRYLGDARAILTRDNAVTLLDFVDSRDSPWPDAARARWLDALSQPQALGACTRRCPHGLRHLHYSLESSLLSIASTHAAAQTATPPAHHVPPQQGSRGLIAHHQLNVYAAQGIAHAGRYALTTQASVGHWTLQGSAQIDRSDADGVVRHALHDLYLQRELGERFLRVGAFVPDFQGGVRQLRAPGSAVYSALGLMAGSSDALRGDVRSASLYPVYVSADREGSVEVYRDGSLILTQPLQPGLQTLDTQRLPGGIYAVELRVMQDGRETSREVAIIHKPTQWRDPHRRWRWRAFAGVPHDLLDSADHPHTGKRALGASVERLLHPRVVAGLAGQHNGNDSTLGASLDWQAGDRVSVFAQGYHSNSDGSGADLQAMLRYRHGSVIASGNRNRVRAARAVVLQQHALAVNHRLGESGHLSARVFQQRGVIQGSGVDVAFSRRQRLWGTDALWRLSVFDRPGTFATTLKRSRGIDFTLNLALGQAGRRYNGSLGTRTAHQGERDLYASVGVQQDLERSAWRALAGQVTVDTEGVGLSATTQFEHPALRGDVYAQRASLDGLLSAGLNLESTLAVGDGHMALAGAGPATMASTAVIVEVTAADADLVLQAHDSLGGSHVLRPGRNLLPVSAYRAGMLQLDFDGRASPSAVLQPSVIPYHLNRGGVTHASVQLVQTVTVVGQLRSAGGEPLAGARVLNHAGRGVAEADGFFALEVNRHRPTLEVHHPEVSTCHFLLDEQVSQVQGDTWMAGILQCPAASTAGGAGVEDAAGEAP